MRNYDARALRLGLTMLVSGLMSLAGATASAQGRMPPLVPEKLTAAQKEAAEEYRHARNAPAGSDITGVYALFLRVPEVFTNVTHIGAHMTSRSALPEKATSLAILVALREWTTQNEWTGKAARAEKAGVKPETIAAIAEGRRPAVMAEDEATIYDFCTELMRNHSVSDPTYARMVAKFGEEGVMEAINIEGFYTLISMALNTARLTPANGAKPLMPLPH